MMLRNVIFRDSKNGLVSEEKRIAKYHEIHTYFSAHTRQDKFLLKFTYQSKIIQTPPKCGAMFLTLFIKWISGIYVISQKIAFRDYFVLQFGN
jgi:hypothetical protein